MAVSKKTIRQRFGKETGLMTLATLTSGDASTLTSTNDDLLGPFSAQRWPRGTAIRVSTLAGAASTQGTYVSTYTPSTGTITVSPTMGGTAAAGDVAEIWNGIENVGRIDEIIDRALTRHCFRWVKTPLTRVADGDMGETATTAWTTSGSTLTKVALGFPDLYSLRSLRVLNAGYARTASMRVKGGENWRLSALVRADVGTATLTAYDVTNSASITLSGDGGSHTGEEWAYLDNTFTVPATCEEIQIRLGSTAANDDTYWAEVIAYNVDFRQFLLPARIQSEEFVGDFYTRSGDDIEHFQFHRYPAAGPRPPLTRTNAGIMVELPMAAGSGDPLFYDELRSYEALATDATETDAPEELIYAAVKYEYWKHAAEREFTKDTPSGFPAPTQARTKRDDALKQLSAAKFAFNPAGKTVYG